MAATPHPWSFSLRPGRRLRPRFPVGLRQDGAPPPIVEYDPRHTLIDLPTWVDDGGRDEPEPRVRSRWI